MVVRGVLCCAAQCSSSIWCFMQICHKCCRLAEKHTAEISYCSPPSSRGMRKLNSVNFLMQTDDSTKQAIFDSVCEQRIKAFSR